MSQAKTLYHRARTEPGIRGTLMRAIVFVHTRVRPPMPFKGIGHRARTTNLAAQDDVRRGPLTVLMLGSNEPAGNLTDMAGAKVTQIDLKRLEHVDIVADAEKLSATFDEASFDVVVSTSMLEHTPHPWTVFDQVRRVLKPGGLFYVSVPWIFPLHGEPDDYWRFSLPGLERLFVDNGFEIVESGTEVSPHGALYTFLRAYVSEALSFGSSIAYYSLEWLTSWLFWPLGLLERALPMGRRTHRYTDSIVFAIGRKRSTAG
jgi:SAM-dependent methyltransferase